MTFAGSSFSSNTGEVFSLGNLSFFNGTIQSGTGVDSVNLTVIVSLTSPAGVGQQGFSFPLQTVNTLNTDDPIASADSVSLIVPAFSTTTFITPEGETLTLEIVGFGSVGGPGGFSTINEFFVLESESTSAELLARFTPPDIQIGRAQLTSPTTVQYKYAVSSDPGQFPVGLYRSEDDTFDASDELVATDFVTPAPNSTGQRTFTLTSPLRGDPAKPFLLVMADPSNSISEANENNNLYNFILPNVTLGGLSSDVFTLMEDFSYIINVSPSFGVNPPTSVSLELRGGPVSDWVEVSTDQIGAYRQRLAGFFEYRASAIIDGIRYFSDEVDVEVQFPTSGEILNGQMLGGSVRQALDDTWALTKANTSQQGAREYGFFIRYNTLNGTYETTDLVEGPLFPPNSGASVPLGFPPDDSIILNGLFGIYTVAFFHTHTGETYTSPSYTRPVGPSQGPGRDEEIAVDLDLPGLVYDYLPTTPDGMLMGGHPLDAPARVWQFGPTRKGTPG